MILRKHAHDRLFAATIYRSSHTHQNCSAKVIATANQELIKLYWSIGKYISDILARQCSKKVAK